MRLVGRPKNGVHVTKSAAKMVKYKFFAFNHFLKKKHLLTNPVLSVFVLAVQTGSYKVRKVYCKKEMAFGQIVRLPDINCDASKKPTTERTCKPKQCKPDSIKKGKNKSKSSARVKDKDKQQARERWASPMHAADHGKESEIDDAFVNEVISAEQSSRATETESGDTHNTDQILSGVEQLNVRVHGSYSVSEGRSIKLRCPRQRVWARHSRPIHEIEWIFNDLLLTGDQLSGKHFEQTSRGALRIYNVTSSLSGTYVCRKGIHVLGRLELAVIRSNQTDEFVVERNHQNLTEFKQADTLKSVLSKAQNEIYFHASSNSSEDTIDAHVERKPSRTEQPWKPLSLDTDNSLKMVESPDVIEMQDDSNVEHQKKPIFGSLMNATSEISKSGHSDLATMNTENISEVLNQASSDEIVRDRFESPHSPSTDSSQIKHLQRLLTKLLTRRSSSRNAMETSHSEVPIETADEHQMAANMISSLSSDPKAEKHLSFDWVISEWSPCSISCGVGFQVNKTTKKIIKLYVNKRNFFFIYFNLKSGSCISVYGAIGQQQQTRRRCDVFKRRFNPSADST